jgi:2-dehydro-3-deoxyphosphogluconate aldolase / (4S)-4-hydroxy-2-oxoglutarate aldolase
MSEQVPKADQDFLRILREDRLVSVIRAGSITNPTGIADALVTAGIRCVEFTLTTPGALEAITEAAKTDAIVGAGSILDRAQATDAVAAGARFLVSPALRTDLVTVAREYRIPVVLGAFTPTEVADGMDAGATALKLFPARAGEAAYVRDLLGPLPRARLIPSGGIGPDDVASFLDAGAVAVYAGSSLASPTAIESGNLHEITKRADRFRVALEKAAAQST